MSITVSKEEVIGFEKLKAISQIAPIEKQKRLHHRLWLPGLTFSFCDRSRITHYEICYT